MSKKIYKADVIVIGGGLAGIVTALELLNKNKKVILLERSPREKFGGLARESFGGVFMVNTPHQKRTGIRDNTDLAYADWCSFAQFSDEDVWPKKWAKHYIQRSREDIYFWLRRHRVNFFPVVHWVERGYDVPGNSLPRFHMVWGTGQWLADALIQALEKHTHKNNLELCFHHNVQNLQSENGAIVGCDGVCEKSEEDFSAQAEAVVVATGGIGGCLDKVRNNWYKPWGEPPKVILNGADPYSDGRMHDAVESLGGKVTHMDKMWNYAAGVHHHTPKFENHGLSLVPLKSALWMNYRGERIGPMPLISGYDTRYLVEQVCRQKEKYSWQIFNWKIAKKELAVSGAESNDAIRDKKLFAFLKTVLLGSGKLVEKLTQDCPDFVVANSVGELVEKMNQLQGNDAVSQEILEAEIRKYDANIDRGVKYHNDDQLRRITQLREYRGDRVRTCRYQKIMDSKAMPLIAVRSFVLSRKTLGGIQTDLDSRVLDSKGDVISGLYAVGEAAGFGGGGSHGLRTLEGTFLGTCILTGQSAARGISKGK